MYERKADPSPYQMEAANKGVPQKKNKKIKKTHAPTFEAISLKRTYSYLIATPSPVLITTGATTSCQLSKK